MNHIRISIQADEVQQELFISELSELGATGFEQTDTNLLAYFDEENFKSYEVNELLKDASFQLDTIPQQNWNALWESNFEPVIVDDFCAIRADFHQPVENVTHEIIITPKMSFGTGHHATTYMMIQQMSRMELRNKTVFDFGTGTGILAILAKKMGAASVTAIDVDDWSIENAKENFERNKIQDVSLYQSSILPAEKFDIVLANINKNVITANAESLSNAVLPGGLLLLSGLLKDDKEDIVNNSYLSIFRLINLMENKNWISLLSKR